MDQGQRDREPDPVVAAFTRHLQRAYEAAGSPRPRRLLKISELLPGPVVIAKSTLHDNLSGTRLTLPYWDWTSVFITCLRLAAEETNLDPDRVVGTIEEWNERHKAAKRALSRSRHYPATSSQPPLAAPVLQDAAAGGPGGFPSGQGPEGGFPLGGARPGDTIPLDMSAIFSSQDADDSGPPGASGGEMAWEFPPPWLPGVDDIVAIDYRDLLGEHGAELLRAAEGGDGEASCRLGILLLCRGAHLDEAMLWLGNAAQREDAMALSLLSADPARRRELAAAYALDLVLPTGTSAGDNLLTPEGMSTRAPAVYYEAAADAGHPGAAYRLGLLKEAEGDTQEALRWYEMAAHTRYPGATHSLQKLRRTLQRGQGRP